MRTNLATACRVGCAKEGAQRKKSKKTMERSGCDICSEPKEGRKRHRSSEERVKTKAREQNTLTRRARFKEPSSRAAENSADISAGLSFYPFTRDSSSRVGGLIQVDARAHRLVYRFFACSRESANAEAACVSFGVKVSQTEISPARTHRSPGKHARNAFPRTFENSHASKEWIGCAVLLLAD